MYKLALLISISIVVVLSQVYESKDYQGAQIIDSKQSYMFNLRYASGSKKIYYRADKSINNVFSATTTDPSKFVLNAKSPINASTTFFAFDVISNKGADFVIGSTFDSRSLGLPLVVASTSGRTSVPVNDQNYYLYTPFIDASSLKADTVDVFFAGWGYEGNNAGLVVARASATLLPDSPSIEIKTSNILPLNRNCYDVWTDTNKPHLYVDVFNGNKYLIVVVPGRCDGIYRIKVDPDTFSKSFFDSFNENATLNSDIFSNTYDLKSKKVFYAFKKYNSDSLYITGYNMDSFTPYTKHLPLGQNDTNPVLALDTNSDSLFFISADSNHIYKIPTADILKKPFPIATLPQKIKSVSSALVVGDFLYLVTYEADAQLARIQISKHFCSHFCGTHGYCGDASGICLCEPGYVTNTSSTAEDRCVPKHEIDIKNDIINDRGIAVAMGIFFFVALFAAVAGWAMWWRGRKDKYSKM